MRILELIAVHAVIFSAVAMALLTLAAARAVVAWLLWSWRGFRREARRAAWLLGVLVTGAIPCAAVAESPGIADGRAWPAFRGVGTSITAARDLPLTWSSEAGIRWTVELPGYGQSSPVVWGERVFVTSMQGENKETPTVVCVALATGEKLWQREFAASQAVAVSNYVSRSAPTPAADEERLYAFFESGDLFTLDHDGNEIWSRSLVQDYGPIEGQHGIGSSVALARESVIVLMSHAGPSYLLAVDKRTGEARWKSDFEKRVAWSSPVVCEDRGREIVLTSGAGLVEAYDAEGGKLLWRLDGLEGNNVPSPTAHRDLVVIGSTARGSNLALRLPADDGGEPSVHWRADGPSSSFGSPLVHQGLVYFVNAAGVAFCVDLESGVTHWKERLGDSCWASPVGAGDRVYFYTKGGMTVVAQAGSEWEELARNAVDLPAGEKLYGVAVIDGAILLRAGSRLTCVADQGGQ